MKNMCQQLIEIKHEIESRKKMNLVTKWLKANDKVWVNWTKYRIHRNGDTTNMVVEHEGCRTCNSLYTREH